MTPSLFRLVVITSSLLCGCHLREQPKSVRVPAVATRFTTNPLPGKMGCPPNIPTTAGLPNLKAGLAMQSFDDPVHLGAVAAVLHPDRATAVASEDPRGGL